MEFFFTNLNLMIMDTEQEFVNLSNEELIQTSGGCPLFRMFCLYVIINREEIWNNTVVQYVEGFREGYSSVVNQ